MRYVALDPGQTTGWATYRREADPDYRYIPGQIPADAVYDFLGSFLFNENDSIDLLIVERFSIRMGHYADLMPVEVQGVVKLWARQHKVDIVWQSASDAKFYWTNDKLHGFGNVWRPNMPHGMDAMRHLLYYITFKGGDRKQTVPVAPPSD